MSHVHRPNAAGRCRDCSARVEVVDPKQAVFRSPDAKDASNVGWAAVGGQEGLQFNPLTTCHDELRSMLRAREKALRDLAAVLRRAGPDNPHRRALNRERAQNRGRLRRLVNNLDASIAAFVSEHQREILG